MESSGLLWRPVSVCPCILILASVLSFKWRRPLFETSKLLLGCCRLANAEVRVGDKQEWSSNPTCDAANNTANNTIAQGQSQNVQCNGKSGKYVFIDIPGRTDSLTLCEVEVFKQGDAFLIISCNFFPC